MNIGATGGQTGTGTGRRRFSSRIRRRIATRGSGPGRQILLVILALLVGAVSALAAVVFREAIDLFQWGILGFRTEKVASLAREMPWWQILFAPALGGLLIGLVCWRWLPKGPVGVVQVVEAATLRAGQMRLRDGLIGALVNSFAIGAGASVGREGPVVHLGATLASAIGDRLRLSRPMMRTLFGCGVASAVAASFNAPIAGSLFALEVFIGHYTVSAFGPIILAAVTGTLISRGIYGESPAFILPPHHIASMWEFPAFALLGLCAGLAAVLMMRGVELLRDLAARAGLPRWLRPAIAGFVIGGLALSWPEMLGVGYEATDTALGGGYGLQALFVLLLLKMFATALCMAMGFGNGMFSPSMFVGAMLGCLFGILAATPVPPELASDSGAYALVGMGSVAGAVLGAPISTILMIFELTGEYTITVAVMTGTVMASAVTQSLYGRSFFYRQLELAGFDAGSGHEAEVLRRMTVETVLERNAPVIDAKEGYREIWPALYNTPDGILYVLDDAGHLEGVISITDFRLFEKSESQESREHSTAATVAREPVAVLEEKATIIQAVMLLRGVHESLIPVVDSGNDRRFLGHIRSVAVMHAYTRAVSEARQEERGEM